MTKNIAKSDITRNWWPFSAAIFTLLGVLLTIGYQYFISQPKLLGKIVTVLYGNVSDVRISSRPLKTMTMYVYLANARETPVAAVDYSLDVRINGVWQRMKLLYVRLENLRLGMKSGGPFGDSSLIIPSDNANLLHILGQPIRREQPIGGLLVFVAEEKYDLDSLDRMKLSVYDGFGNSHIIEQPRQMEHDPQVLMRLIQGIIVEKPK